MLFWVSGIAFIAIGSMSLTTYTEIATFTGSALSRTSMLLIAEGIIVVGITVSVISFLGCFGARTDSRSLRASILVMILTMEIVAGISLYVLRSKVDEIIKKKARSVISEYSVKNRPVIDDVQDECIHCCGAENYTNWFRSKGWGNRSSVPDSCCLVEYDFCGQSSSCVQTIRQYPGKNLVWVAAACIGLGVVEVFGALLGMCLFQDLRRRSYEKIYLK
ncbi:CD63 antigen-like [Salvelinus sp. IW2-2015]|uniref:CD63 antigen-like n=1 Tax=Salvelinus sp. IW2-2015 TaxID=2691554 RepID=UPI0038D40C30